MEQPATPLQAAYSPPHSVFLPLFPRFVSFTGKVLRFCAACLSLLAFIFIGKLSLWPETSYVSARTNPNALVMVSGQYNFLAVFFTLSLFTATFITAFMLYRRNLVLTAEKAAFRRELQHLRQEFICFRSSKADSSVEAEAEQSHFTSFSMLKALLDATDKPLWLRDKNGALQFTNKTCTTLLQACRGNTNTASLPNAAADDPDTLFSPDLRRALQDSRQKCQNFSGKTNLILKGDRHIFFCHSFYDTHNQCFLESAEDITENLSLREETARIKQGYAETFDRLSTSVAIFDPNMKLEFFNSAFAALWPLETAFLDSKPDHALLLDCLREKGILNERPDWRQWKEELFEAYHSPDPQHYLWNLPDGRTLRVVANPHPQGGVTWLFDDLTENVALQARYNTLIRMQGETLDNLAEGVAVFGANGRLRLANPSFAALWHLPADLAIEETHIEKIKKFCQKNNAVQTELTEKIPAQADKHSPAAKVEKAITVWQKIAFSVTDFSDKRDIFHGRTELADKSVFDYMLVPLPQGQTMLTFLNVTDSVNIARALHERNTALESADKLRNNFIQHVSYELRTPLTNIIGFTELLATDIYGTLNNAQANCLKDITAESKLLLNLVNDILDLATIDAGIMELNIKTLSIENLMHYAAQRVAAKLVQKNIVLKQHIAPGLTIFEADEMRVRQIFVNLLHNAVNAAPENSHIQFYAKKDDNMLSFIVEDEGKGIPAKRQEDIFKRFTTYAYKGQKTGIGLGLSIVKSFIELHQGHVLVESGENGGTKFICRFPFHETETQKLVH